MNFNFFNLLESDAASAFVQLEPDDFAYPVCVLTWIIILCIPLNGVDRRDPLTFVNYLVFLLSSGILMFIIVPALTMAHETAYLRDIIMISIITAIVGLRWVIGNDKKNLVVKVDVSKITKVSPKRNV